VGFFRPRAAALAVLLLLGLAAAPRPASAAAPVLKVVPASADASVRVDRPTATSGKARTLRVDGNRAARAYLRFKVTGLTGRVVSAASLWVWRTSPKAPFAGLTARGTNGKAWSEATLAWWRRPAILPPAGTAVKASGRWLRLDVTRLVRQNGTVDVAVTTAKAQGITLAAREAGRARAPRLHLRVGRDAQPKFPIRAAVYDPSYPARWSAGTRYHPAAGRYDGAAPATLVKQLQGLAYGRFGAALAAWDGPASASDARLASILGVTALAKSGVRWAAQPSAEAKGAPSASKIAELLARLDADHGRDPAYLRVRGRPVVFVPTGAKDGCDAVKRWVAGNARQRAYLVMQGAPGAKPCDAVPSDRYRADPSVRADRLGASAYAISPGAFGAKATRPALNRDLEAWNAAVRAMDGARGARWHLVASYNGWADGSAVEPATEWASRSGWGHYLDALHASGQARSAGSADVVAVADVACSVWEREHLTGEVCRDDTTAKLVSALNPSAVLIAGDTVHGSATTEDYREQYDPTWGAFKARTFPAPGNHEYCVLTCADPQAAIEKGYFAYFGDRAGPVGRGWYSFDAGPWHVVSLNSECRLVPGGCAAGSPQERWLRDDLAAHPSACTLAYFHRPRFTGGHEGEAPSLGPIWTTLHQAGVELVINGHQHQYERFAPQDPARRADPGGGITEIVAGTGGRSHIPPVTVRSNTVVQNADTFGVLRLELKPLGLSWRFVPAPGTGSFTDAGSRSCH
jgi:hypothetical protein